MTSGGARDWAEDPGPWTTHLGLTSAFVKVLHILAWSMLVPNDSCGDSLITCHVFLKLVFHVWQLIPPDA